MRRRGNGFGRRMKRGFRRMREENPTGFYRSRDGIFMGVCSGLADYFNLPLFWVRALFVLCFFFGGVFPIVFIYIIAGLLIKPEPVMPLHSDSDHEFYDSYVNSRSSAIQRLKRKFDKLNKRIQRLEDCVTSREYDWDQRLHK